VDAIIARVLRLNKSRAENISQRYARGWRALFLSRVDRERLRNGKPGGEQRAGAEDRGIRGNAPVVVRNRKDRRAEVEKREGKFEEYERIEPKMIASPRPRVTLVGNSKFGRALEDIAPPPNDQRSPR